VKRQYGFETPGKPGFSRTSLPAIAKHRFSANGSALQLIPRPELVERIPFVRCLDFRGQEMSRSAMVRGVGVLAWI
jgi:hypothetical protein